MTPSSSLSTHGYWRDGPWLLGEQRSGAVRPYSFSARGKVRLGRFRKDWPKILMITSVVLMLPTSALRGQNTKLSLLSSLTPGALLHFGVETPDAPDLSHCFLLLSGQGPSRPWKWRGVPVVVAPPVLALPMFRQAEPGSTHARWSIDTRVPVAPPGVPLYSQAILVSTSGEACVSNGTVTHVRASGPTETRFGFASQPTDFTLFLIDVDNGPTSTTVPTRNYPLPPNRTGWVADLQPMTASEDGRRVACKFHVNNAGASPDEGAVAVVDLVTNTVSYITRSRPLDAWIPVGPVRFSPTSSDHLLVREEFSNQCNNNLAHDSDFVEYAYQAVSNSWSEIARVHLESSCLKVGSRMELDSSGSFACFLAGDTTAGLPSEILTVQLNPLRAAIHVPLPHSAGRTFDLLVVPGTTRVAATFDAAGPLFPYLVDWNSSSVVFLGNLNQTGVRLQAVSKDGAYVVFARATGNRNELVAIDSATGFGISMPPVEVSHIHHSQVCAVAADIVVAGHASVDPNRFPLMHRLTRSGAGLDVATSHRVTPNGSVPVMHSTNGERSFVALAGKEGMLIVDYYNNLLLLDAATMTWCSLRVPADGSPPLPSLPPPRAPYPSLVRLF